MHNFLFGNRLQTQSPFSPFGSTKNSKPGIITKIKNKIQDLFQPSINPSSTIQRIHCYNELNFDTELSHQFKNNLVIVDHIIPNNEEYLTSKRKSLYPFDLYYQEVIQKQNQISEEAQNNKVIRMKDQSPYLTKTKKQMKFKKNHAKFEKSRKMEAYQQQRDFDFNNKSQNLNIESNQENSSSFISSKQIKKNDYFKDCIETATPYDKQKEQNNGQLNQKSQFEIQSFEIIKSNQQNDYQQLSDQKQQIFQTQNRHVNFKQIIQENQYFSSSTGTNTKGETLEALLNMEHISYYSETDSQISEEMCSNDSSLEIQNKLFFIFHPDNGQQSDFDKKTELEQNRNIDDIKNNNQNQISLEKLEQQQQQQQQFKKQRNLILESEIINLQIQCNRQNLIECKNEQQILNSQQLVQQQQKFICQEDNINNQTHENIFKSDKQELKLENNQNILEINKDEISQQQSIQQKIQHGLLQKQLDEKLETPQSQNTLLSMNYESTPKTSKIIQENDQQKELSQKENQNLKQNNPFLDSNSHISSDQVSQYFLQGYLTGNSQFPQQQQVFTRNQNFLDLFKLQTNNQLFNFNVPQENQGYQTQNLCNSQNIAQKNDQCLIYKQMEIIDQIPFQEQFNVTQQNNYHQPISNYYSPHFEQKYQCQPVTFQQSQSNNPLINYQAPIQQQNLCPQMQQCSYQISSINLFQSNSSLPNSNPNCCQEEGRMNHLYTKQDVLSFFQDTNKKQDKSLFVIDTVQNSNSQSNSQSQNLNNSFTRGYKRKQRINNN